MAAPPRSDHSEKIAASLQEWRRAGTQPSRTVWMWWWWKCGFLKPRKSSFNDSPFRAFGKLQSANSGPKRAFQSVRQRGHKWPLCHGQVAAKRSRHSATAKTWSRFQAWRGVGNQETGTVSALAAAFCMVDDKKR